MGYRISRRLYRELCLFAFAFSVLLSREPSSWQRRLERLYGEAGYDVLPDAPGEEREMITDSNPMPCSRFLSFGTHMFYAGSAFAVCCGRNREQAREDQDNMMAGRVAIAELVNEIHAREQNLNKEGG